jgi:sterol desaturase/sphingolipid hydroxylase (fatty acid hydroxylase superfamily)
LLAAGGRFVDEYKCKTASYTAAQFKTIFCGHMTNSEWLNQYFGELSVWGRFIAVFLVLELLWPAQRRQSLAGKLFNLHYLLYYIFMTVLLVGPLTEWVMAAGKSLFPAFSALLSLGEHLPMPIYVLIYLLFYDFFYYWFHRAQHRFSMLWRIHRLHHSEPELNASSAGRHHWLEEPLKIFVVIVPLAIVFDAPPQMTGWVALLVASWAFLIHANLRLGIGPLSWLVTTPQMHRIHHSQLLVHTDKNFAAIFPIWDILFGTYHAPKHDEFPNTGLHDARNYHSVLAATLSPVLEPTRP